jgi:RNA polymerase sigma-70 factor, ECF subfamily
VIVCPFDLEVHPGPERRSAGGRTLHGVSAPGVVASKEDLAIVERLRAGDELAFMMLVDQHTAAMLRIARMYVSSRAVAEDVVAEAWLGVVRGIERFEGRSSLRTWIYRIVANIAKTRGAAEGRSVPFSSLAGDDETGRGVEPSWFYDVNGRTPGGWTTFPEDWRGIPEARLLGNETLRRIGRAIENLPPLQAEVIRLRDVLGWSSDEVRNALDLSEVNQRVLLHRARTRVRRELDEYLRTGSEDA